MIKIVLQILLISLPVLGFGQSSKVQRVELGCTKNLPLKNAKAYYYDPPLTICSVSRDFSFEATSDSLFSISTCVVENVGGIQGRIYLVTKDTSGIIYNYAFLKKVLFKKGDIIKKGSFIGLIDVGNKISGFRLAITTNDNCCLSEKDQWNLLNVICSETLNSTDEKMIIVNLD